MKRVLSTSVSVGVATGLYGISFGALASVAGLDLLRALALAELPTSSDADLERYSKGVVHGAMLQALAREKNDLLAALKRIDMTAQPEAYAQVQRQLVELEAERRTYMA